MRPDKLQALLRSIHEEFETEDRLKERLFDIAQQIYRGEFIDVDALREIGREVQMRRDGS